MSSYKQLVLFQTLLASSLGGAILQAASSESTIEAFIDELWPEDGDISTHYPVPTRENILVPADMALTEDELCIIETAMRDVQNKLPTILRPHSDGTYRLTTAARRALQTEDPTDALYEHAIVGNISACAILIARSADVNHQPARHLGNTALHAACSGPTDNYNIVHFLLMHGALPNGRNAAGKTPLHLACERGHHATTKVLLLDKASHQLQDKHYQDTPLHTACRYGHPALAARLLKHKADVKAVDRVGHTPLGLALVCGHQPIIDLLRAHGATE